MIKKILKFAYFYFFVLTISLLARIPLVLAEGEQDKAKLLPTSTELLQTNPASVYSPTLPSGDFISQVAPSVIKILLAVSAPIVLVAFAYGGTLLVSARGDEGDITKGKNIVIYSAIGLILISVSYAVVYGIISLEFE